MKTTTANLTEILSVLMERFKNHQWIKTISLKEENFIPYIQAHAWGISSLSHGLPGMICLYSEMDHVFPDQGWDRVTHQLIVDLIQDLETNGITNASLFSGLTGVCFAIQLASKEGTRYQTLLNRLVPILLEKIKEQYLLPSQESLAQNDFVSPFQYDVIVGMSGVINFLLTVRHIPLVNEALEQMISILSSLQKPVIYQNVSIPGWFVPSKYFIRDEVLKAYQKGCFDTGMAHGVSGCLAALSNAYLAGNKIPAQESAIRQMSTWLMDIQIKHGTFKDGWPSRLSYDPVTGRAVSNEVDFHRDGWCYGDPGIACALLLASKALSNRELRELAINSLVTVCERPEPDRNLTCVSFCHGQASYLTILHHFYLETGLKIFHEKSEEIAKRILEQFDENLPFGFKVLVSVPNSDEQLSIDNAGFLDGVAGTLLSLLYANSKEQRAWTTIYGIT